MHSDLFLDNFLYQFRTMGSELLALFSAGSVTPLLLLFAVGLAQNYWGYILYRLWACLAGAGLGFLLGGAVAGSLATGSSLVLAGSMAGALVCGGLAFVLHKLAALALGGFLGGTVIGAVYPGAVPAAVGATIGGLLFVGLHRFAVVLTTVVLGSLALTYCTLSVAGAVMEGGAEFLFQDRHADIRQYILYLSWVFESYDLPEVLQRLGPDLATMGFYAASGLYLQLRTARKKEQPNSRRDARIQPSKWLTDQQHDRHGSFRYPVASLTPGRRSRFDIEERNRRNPR